MVRNKPRTKKTVRRILGLMLALCILMLGGMETLATGSTGTDTSVGSTGTDAPAGTGSDNGETGKAAVGSEPVRGIYVSAHVAGMNSMMEEIITHLDETNLNAVVIDAKNDEGNVTFSMDRPLVQEAGSVQVLVGDMPGLISKLHDHGIYCIARCVMFRDPFIDEVHPEWMLPDEEQNVYYDSQGFSWIDPTNTEAAAYLMDIVAGCKEAGFDEVQFDYVRYATGVSEEAIGLNGYGKRTAITRFVMNAKRTADMLGIPLSLDVFGTVINSRIDSNIVGQEYPRLSMFCDYMSPMIYPSHYYDGSFGTDVPDLHPYETIDGALKVSIRSFAIANPAGNRKQAKVRPWLQGFTATYLKKYRKYGAEEVKLQIQAVYDNGGDSYLIWNPSCKYPWDAFKD